MQLLYKVKNVYKTCTFFIMQNSCVKVYFDENTVIFE